MGSFLAVLLGVTFLFQCPFALAAFVLASRAGASFPKLVALAATVLAFVLFAARARAGMPERKRHEAIVRFVDIPQFIHWCAAAFAFVPSVVGSFLLGLGDLLTVGSPRFHGDLYAGAYLLGLVVSSYGILVRRRIVETRKLDIPIRNLPPSFDGYTIAHLSDLHIGALTPKAWGHKWVRQSNEQRPDLVVVTGDMVTSGTEFHEDIAEVVGALQSRDGVVVSMGNHDYFGDGEPLVSHLRQRHVRVLRNEGLLLRRDTGEIFLSAIDDTWTRRADLGKALAQRPSGMPTVLLAHDPGAFPAARGQDVDLVLSGHTHGGQIAMPFLGRWLSLSHLVHKFHIGIYRDGRSTLFVHPGLGTTGPPMRLGVAPAIVLLRLRPA